MQGDCVRNCKRNAVVEGSSTGAAVAKRRRVVGFASPNVELENQRLCMDSGGMNAGDLCSSFCTDQFPSSCCSSNESSEVMRDNLRRLDLEAKSSETVDSTYIKSKFRETTPSSELCGDSNEMDSLAAKTPPKAEIEEFFAMAEKYEQKRFAEKYNYDIAKDVPLEGRYQWIRLKP
ncbi:cyclin-dependent kinase inhibitor 7 isoform X2 [Alnus glutinosa]|uniref:cyclin-dependent kinase inhibitor 7 isoform X2 n=1 Tax=Alnus glutinosa TaxID=3517 RepID=UPI002D78223B|nr:cyclin-dependent kinase inhibitor 7 isoform X2 [Alnus glutinosa]